MSDFAQIQYPQLYENRSGSVFDDLVKGMSYMDQKRKEKQANDFLAAHPEFGATNSASLEAALHQLTGHNLEAQTAHTNTESNIARSGEARTQSSYDDYLNRYGMSPLSGQEEDRRGGQAIQQQNANTEVGRLGVEQQRNSMLDKHYSSDEQFRAGELDRDKKKQLIELIKQPGVLQDFNGKETPHARGLLQTLGYNPDDILGAAKPKGGSLADAFSQSSVPQTVRTGGLLGQGGILPTAVSGSATPLLNNVGTGARFIKDSVLGVPEGNTNRPYNSQQLMDYLKEMLRPVSDQEIQQANQNWPGPKFGGSGSKKR